MIDRLVRYLHSIHPLSEGLRGHLEEILYAREIRKREKLLRPGQVSQHIYFIEKGLFRCSYMSAGKEVCVWFMKEGDVIVSVGSFFFQATGQQTIHAMEDGCVYSITHTQLQEIYHRYPEFNVTGRLLLEKYYAQCEERLWLARIPRVENRFAAWLKSYPDLAERIPAKYIAAYLGTTVETLSRIKRSGR